MREILFRGQTRRYGEKVRMGDGQKLPSHWVYGGVLQGVGDHSIIYGGENENDPSVGLDKWGVYTDTLGQFTGLIDKNGKKIFEGDIVEIKDFSRGCALTYKQPTSIWVVKWYVETAKFGIDYMQLFPYDFKKSEVIGNIHDNPELLEE